MVVVVAYDVNTENKNGRRRLRRVAQACEDFGQRVQKSVFECVLRSQDWVRLRTRLLSEIDEKQDSLRFYFIDDDARQKTEHHGIRKPIDLEGTLIA
jgi:CRISPR-associated protein Cas2